ncbi:MAG: S8 family serine peptidase [Hyphomicrobiaceae bacterium]
MSPAMMGRAQGLGFKLQQTTLLPSLDMTLQRLLPPPGMDAMRARDVLGQPGGNASVALNEVYRPIRAATATEPDGTPLRRTPQPAATGGCSAERCFGMKAIRWDTQLQSCSQGVRIGMIDTMVDQQHPALRVAFGDKRIEAQSFIGKGRRVAPSGHGTGILSILAGAAQSGTPGLVPNANFRVADIFHADANGQPLADTASLLAALDWMAKEQVKVVNLSVAGPHDELMERAIERLAKKDMIFVAAAGNEGPAAPPMYPAAYKSVIAVTAVAKDLRGYRQANRGDYIDAAAPGVDVWTALPDSKENFQSGTSFAVPFATAVVATVYAQVKHKTKESVLAAIEFKDLGLPGRDTVFGRGLMMAPQRCSGSGGEVARAPSFTPVMALPSGVGASSVGFGFASGKP